MRNTKEAAVITQAEAYDAILQGRVKGFLGLPMRSLTTEEIAKLKAKAKALKSQITEYSKQTFEEYFIRDLDNITLIPDKYCIQAGYHYEHDLTTMLNKLC